MAKSTSNVSFPIFRDYSAAAASQDVIGYFHCRLATAKFLDIEDLAKEMARGFAKEIQESKERDMTLVDGTVLKKSDKNKDGKNEKHLRLISSGKKGTKSVRLITGKLTANKNYKSVSFLFPGFATNLIVSDALGSIIPATKMSANPSETEVFNFFLSAGGKRYPIMTKDASNKEKSSTTPTTSADAAELAQKVGAQVIDVNK